MEKVLLGIGGNIGNVHETFAKARCLIEARAGKIVRESPEETTAPIDCAPGTPDFLNAVWEIQTALEPEALLSVLQKIECECGRPPVHGHNANRTLDLDILTFGTRTIHLPNLIIPHPRMNEREFVLRQIRLIKAYE